MSDGVKQAAVALVKRRVIYGAKAGLKGCLEQVEVVELVVVRHDRPLDL